MDERTDDPYRLSVAACEKLASATLDQAAKASYLGLAHHYGDFRFWHLADIQLTPGNVRFRG